MSTTASAAQPVYAQPPFDKRISTIPIPGNQSSGSQYLARGYMVWDHVIQGYPSKCLVRFLYNPSVVSASYAIDSSQSSTESTLLYADPSDQAQYLAPMNQTVSFALLFDRSFELWGSYETNGQPAAASSNVNDPAANGVGVDILALKQFTYQLAAANQSNSGAQNGNASAGASIQGIMNFVPAWVYFGPPSGVYYYGFITDFAVQFTQFTQYMVPMRAVVNVDFTLLPPPAGESITGNGASTWWSLIGVGALAPSPVLPAPSSIQTAGGKGGT